MAEQLPCPICGAEGGFHNSHPFSLEWATERWGPPIAVPPTDEEVEKGYQPYIFIVGEDEFVVIKKKVSDEVRRGRQGPEKPLQGGPSLSIA